MKLDDFIKGEVADANGCALRGSCPLGTICGKRLEPGDMPLVPTFLQVDRGEMLWTDLHFNPRVIVIRKGVFSCLVHVDRGRDEVPLALYGAGIAIGMAELFVPDAPQKRDVAMSSMYYLRSVFAGEICVFPAGIIRKALEIELPERAPS